MKTIITSIAIGTCCLIMTACMGPSKKFTEKKLVVRGNDSVRIPELDLMIVNHGCGRKWIMDDSNRSYEKPYCDLIFKVKDSVYRGGGDYEPVYIGNIKIVVDRINPWGREEDSVPGGGCRLWVSKIEGR